MCYSSVCMDLAERLSQDLDGNFLELVAAHQDLVYGVALRVVGRPADAEDVAQETFIKAHRALSRYPQLRVRELRLRPWLARIALNQARNAIRARRDSAELDAESTLASRAADGPVLLAERREEGRFWLSLLEAVPHRYRLAVALRHVEGLSYHELAEALDRPLGTVKSDVHRGVSLLRAAYEAELRRQPKLEAVG